ncbi:MULTISPECIES: DUF4349 domain-containing protein [unclassified Streptomyces]|uniref:DUF4349 domain-containing protein n=1 Tax=unclassified Streptomyces TaxID=2593676 RepID=UPI0006AF5C12|nr:MULTISPECIES: DUF4349 domain-containing protein [unclassified Streptomyces]KOU92310.1 hypothetical protein ADK93_07180 [Streptomyces sp. XY58]KOV07201.1 hypothetical protein ADK89_12015 [Streptomyces sp. XY37]KOV32992.1 hypothetical protein ADK97_20640 [Streptomyces sp. H021]KOV49428.1 hypothetical protein ADK99_12730 [Streptomyces sp. MMG1064]
MHSISRHRSAAALAALSLTGVLVLTGCGADGQGSASDKAAVAPPAADGKAREGAAGAAAAPAPAGSAGSAAKSDGAPVTVRPNVIRTATLGIETTDVQKTLAAARTAADGAGGYVGNESTKRGEDGRMTSTVTLRVPGERYDAVLGAMEGSGKLVHRKVDAQDVTEKVADVNSRVSSQQASVARVREMMGKASALSEVVMLESELSRRQSDLESLLAQQTALKDQTSMGTITLEVSEPAPAAAEEKKEKEPTFLGALSGGWDVFTRILRYLMVALGALLPFLLTAAVVALLVRAYRRWRPARPKTGPTPKRMPVPAARTAPAAGAAGPAPAPAPAPAADTGADVQD